MHPPQTTSKSNGMSMQHLEPAEVLSVLRAAKTKGHREWAMIVVAYKHGMRASEVCNLRVDDLDLNYVQRWIMSSLSVSSGITALKSSLRQFSRCA